MRIINPPIGLIEDSSIIINNTYHIDQAVEEEKLFRKMPARTLSFVKLLFTKQTK